MYIKRHLDLAGAEFSLYYQDLARKAMEGTPLNVKCKIVTRYGEELSKIRSESPETIYHWIIESLDPSESFNNKYYIIRGLLLISNQAKAHSLRSLTTRITSIGFGEAILSQNGKMATERLTHLLFFLYHYSLFTEIDLRHYMNKHPTEAAGAKELFLKGKNLYHPNVHYYSEVAEIHLDLIREIG